MVMFLISKFKKGKNNQNSSCCDKLYFPISLENYMKRMMKQVDQLYISGHRGLDGYSWLLTPLDLELTKPHAQG